MRASTVNPVYPVVLMRGGRSVAAERAAASAVFPVVSLRSEVPAGSLVIGRYSVIPHPHELEQDVRNLGSTLVNAAWQHDYVANLDYAQDLADVTFPTWFRARDIPRALHDKAFVVKGRTNSRKEDWVGSMFANNFQQANALAARLRCDLVIGQQGVVFRQYVPLETFEHSAVGGLPYTNEWRLFYYKGQLLAHGYYWGGIEDWSHVERAQNEFEKNGMPFADAIAARVVDQIPFVVLDVARGIDGRWWLVELNDGCQSGLNDTIDAGGLYRNLKTALVR